MAEIHVRKAIMEDVEHIMKWIRQENWCLHDDDIRMYIQLYGDGLYVAEDDGTPAGNIATIHVHDLCNVAPGMFGIWISQRRRASGIPVLMPCHNNQM